jgi:hypothetical protein
MRVFTRQVYKTGDNSLELLSFDRTIKCHAYELSVGQLGELMRAGLHLVAELAELEDHPLQAQAAEVLSEWSLFLPARMRPKVGEQDLGPNNPAAEAAAAPAASPATAGPSPAPPAGPAPNLPLGDPFDTPNLQN